VNRTSPSGEGQVREMSGINSPAWPFAWPAMTPAVVPRAPVLSDHITAGWRELRPVVLPPFVALPASCEQFADGLMERLSAASATEQADLADELTRLANSIELVNWEAPAEGRFETLRGGKK